MKPLGPIPQGFTALEGELAIAGRGVSDLVREAGNAAVRLFRAGDPAPGAGPARCHA